MIPVIKRVIVIIVLVSFRTNAGAQVVLIQNVIDKMERHQNFSYQFINKRKDFSTDTSIQHKKEVYMKAAHDSAFGYLFKLETAYKTEKFVRTDVYNGSNLIYLFPEDNSYEVQNVRPSALFGTLLQNLHWIKGFVEKSPFKLVEAGDTTIDGISNMHLVVTTFDTVIGNEHLYTLKHLFIERQSGLPTLLITKSRNKNFGDAVSEYYDENRYTDYQFDQANVNASTFAKPAAYRLRSEKPAPAALLKPGTVAPDWTLTTADGKKLSLAQLKGKVVLLDFYFIGCLPCMNTIAPLNNLYKKYKNENILIASVTGRDGKKAVSAFKKQYSIKYTGFVDAVEVIKSYHVNDFPTFYFIDKEGKIAEVFTGYGDGFEGKVAAIIDRLLNK